MEIKKSTREGKRLMAIFKNGRITHFGLEGGKTYIDTGDKNARSAYLARHRLRENWNDPYSAGALSRWILWGDSTDLQTNHRSFMKRFEKKLS